MNDLRTALHDELDGVPGQAAPLDHAELQRRAARSRLTSTAAVTALVGLVVGLALGMLPLDRGTQSVEVADQPTRTPTQADPTPSGAEDEPFDQEAALEDGVVDFSEYERAALATIECLRGNGVPISEPLSYNQEVQRFEFSYGGGGTTFDMMVENDRIYDTCYEQFQEDVDRAWAHQTAPSP